jgi:penicillin-binding protein 1C
MKNLSWGRKLKRLSFILEYRIINRFKPFFMRLVEKIKNLTGPRLALWLMALTGGMIVLGFLGLVFLFAWYSRNLPSPSGVVRKEGFTTRIYDRNGELLYDVYKETKRTPVVWENIPDYLKQATIAIEDKEFYQHSGFSKTGYLRQVYNIFRYGKLEGGSTLTQQLVKNALLSSERTVSRKIKEFVLAIQIEKKYSKDEILLMYLNEAPYGGAAWGVGAAVEQYFDKEVSELNLVESVFLAGLPQRPSVYSPFSSTPDAYVGRAQNVARRMREDGHINEDQEKEIVEMLPQLEFSKNRSMIRAPHFVFWVKDVLAQRYGEDVVETGGLKVTTTLDLDLQTQAEDIVTEEMEKAESMGISNGGVMVTDPQTGEILAMVGSKDYFSEDIDGKYNVTTALRQPGSAIKPVTYLTALKHGYTASTMIMDTEVVFPIGAGQKDYRPVNYNGKFNGPMQLRYALGNSINVTAVKMLAKVGLENMLTQAYEMGLSTLEPTRENMSRLGLSVTLGGGEVKLVEMAEAYGSFANQGLKMDLTGVLKVEDEDGKVLEEFRPGSGKRVMSEQEAFLISDILADNSARELTFGAVNGLIISGRKVAVKTGTTNDKRDNWCIGWTPNLLVGVWVGNNDNSEMGRVASGVSGATPIWRRVMSGGLKNRPNVEFSIPEKIVSMEVDRISGYEAHDGYESRSEYFLQGTEPKLKDPIHLKLKVCRGEEGLAPPADVSSGNYDEKEFFSLKEEDPFSTDGRNRWQEGIDAWIATQVDSDKYFPPSEYCRGGDSWVKVTILEPGDKSTVGNNFSVKIRTDSVKKILETKLFVDRKEVKSWSEKPFETGLSLEDGVYELHVEAKDEDGNTGGGEIRIGVNKAWDWAPSPTPTDTPIPTPTTMTTVTPTLFVSPTP